MVRLLAIVPALACLTVCPVFGDDPMVHLPERPPDHPRLLVDAKGFDRVKDRIAGDDSLERLAEHITTLARGMVELKPLRRQKTGRRLLGVSRACLKRVSYLAMAARLSGDAALARRAEQEMLAVARFKDWNPSHFLDVAEMTAALAIGYDWLYDELDPEARRTIAEAILEKGLRTSMKGGWWVRTNNNWNQVCHGGLTMGALAVWEHDPELAEKVIRRAVENVPRATREYAPDGAYPEGPTYWGYGTTYNVLLISALEKALGSDFGLSRAKGFLASSDYMLHVTGPTGLFFNYSDCGLDSGVTPALYWFANRRRKPSVLWFQQQKLEAFFKEKHKPDGGDNRLLPMVLIWAGPTEKAPPPKPRHWHADGPTPVAMHRSGWDDEATWVAIKGGSPKVNHAHMDVGTFVVDALGTRWAEDLGMQSYHSLESKGIRLWSGGQRGQRWTVFRLTNAAHNTLVVDGKLQRVAGRAPIVKHQAKGPMPHTLVDMSEVYKGQLASARRGVGVGLGRDGAVVVQDEIETGPRQSTVRWAMVTRAKVTLVDDHTAELTRDGKRLTLHVLAPEAARLEIVNTANPPADYDQPNPGTRMVAFKVTLPGSTKATLSVALCPGKVEPKPPGPLEKW